MKYSLMPILHLQVVQVFNSLISNLKSFWPFLWCSGLWYTFFCASFIIYYRIYPSKLPSGSCYKILFVIVALIFFPDWWNFCLKPCCFQSCNALLSSSYGFWNHTFPPFLTCQSVFVSLLRFHLKVILFLCISLWSSFFWVQCFVKF